MENLDRKNACTPEENTGIDILLVGIEVSVGISDTFFSEGINVSFAVHPVSILIHGADDVVALTVVEIGFASYLNGAVSVCRWIVVILISVGVFDAVLVEGVRDSVGILPASVRHLAYIHAVSAAVIEITGSFGGSGLATAGGVSAIGRTVVCGSGGAVVSASCGSSSRTIVSAAGSSGRASGGRASGGCTAAGSGGAAGSSTSCSSGGAGRSAGGTGIGSGRSLVTIIIGSSAGFGLAGLLSCFLCCLLGGFLCLGLRLCGNKSGCLRLTYLDFFSLFAAAA